MKQQFYLKLFASFIIIAAIAFTLYAFRTGEITPENNCCTKSCPQQESKPDNFFWEPVSSRMVVMVTQ